MRTNPRPLQILVLDHTPACSESLQAVLGSAPWHVQFTDAPGRAETLVKDGEIDVLVADVELDGAMALLESMVQSHPEVTRIALAGNAGTGLMEDTINRAEVFRFFTKPWGDKDVRVTFAQIRERIELRTEVARLLEVTQTQNEALRNWNEQLEERVAERTRALLEAEATIAQHERLAAIGQLAGGVAHEINNPLGAIAVFARTAARDLPPNHPAAADLREIQKAANQAKKIVQSLLTFSRRSRPEERTALDLSALVKQSQPLLQAVCKTPVRYELAETPAILANASRLQQVIVNLASNADHASAGHGAILIRVHADGDAAVLEVSDEGPGIDPAVLPHIFEPFFTTKSTGGTGLGLAIAYGIIREHGGMIGAENLTPRGSRFTVRLPRSAQHQKVA